MYQSASALNAFEQWQNNVAHNLANVSTAGYKKQAIALHNDPMGKLPTENFTPFERMLLGASPEAKDKTNFDQGTLKNTGKETDFAIDGEGFFTAQLPEGGVMYTRSGQFHLNAEGTLVTTEGYPVLSQAGGEITLGVEDENTKDSVYVNRRGEIFRGEDQVGALGVTFIEDKTALAHREGGFVVRGATATRPATEEEFSIYQGHVEGSNSSAMREMINMINIGRSFESNSRIIQAFDSRYGQTISQLSVS